MIKIDVSKAIPQRLWTYLLGLIPGLLFELSIAIANPQLAHSMIDRARQIYPFRPYSLLALFMASCLVVGQVFFLSSWFVDMLIGFSYGLKRQLVRITFGSWWLYRLFAKIQRFPPRRSIFVRSLSWIIFRARLDRPSLQARPVLRCWRLAAEQLLKRGYGIDRSKHHWPEGESEVWYMVLGKPSATFQEALMTTRTFIGCGLAGFSALYVSPALRDRYFIPLCVVFTFVGCYQSFDLAKWRQHPVRNSIAHLRSVLSELSETQTAAKKEESSPTEKTDLEIDPSAEAE